MSRYRFTVGEEADWHALHALLTACFAGMEGRIDPPSSLNRMTAETLRGKARDEVLVQCFWNRDLVGCGFLAPKAGVLYMGKLATAPAHRRKGILRRIMEIAEVLARQRGLCALVLQTRIELVENHAAFAALGFQETGTTAHLGFDRPTSVTMRKAL
ncbi:MAG: GNAT family N-acetyltransferase [Rhodobacter sp.]|nr:GNAT family N-acetyltransferase [Rhodobacter sp.]